MDLEDGTNGTAYDTNLLGQAWIKELGNVGQKGSVLFEMEYGQDVARE